MDIIYVQPSELLKCNYDTVMFKQWIFPWYTVKTVGWSQLSEVTERLNVWCLLPKHEECTLCVLQPGSQVWHNGTIPKQQETSIFVSTSKNYLVNVNQNIITVFKSIDNNDKSATEIKLGYEEKN